MDAADGWMMDNDALISLPAAPASFRSFSSPSSYLGPSSSSTRPSSLSRPLLQLSDDDGEEAAQSTDSGHSYTATAGSVAAASSAAAVHEFRLLRVSDPTGRSPQLAHSAARFHPYTRQPPQPQHSHQQLPASQPSSPPLSSSIGYSSLPLPLSTSFSKAALSYLPEPPPSHIGPLANHAPSTAAFPRCPLPPPPTAAAAPRAPSASVSSASSVEYHRHRLAVVSSRESVASVSCECVAELLSDVPGSCARYGFSRLRVIDCRFQYEYDGGHIRGAEWLADHTDLDGLLASSMQPSSASSASLAAAAADSHLPLLECVILHCEFSRHRAPAVYRAVRRRDRELNGIESFPSLHLPELYVMQAGYAAFHPAHPQLCEPHSGAYVSMLDRRYQTDLKRDWKLRKHSSSSSGASRPLLMPAAPLTRATSDSSALTQRAEQEHNEQRLGHDNSPPLSTFALSSACSPLSSDCTPPLSGSASSFQLPPPLQLSAPTGSGFRLNRRRQGDGEAGLLRSASCVALRQPLSFHSLNATHSHSRTDSESIDSTGCRYIGPNQRRPQARQPSATPRMDEVSSLVASPITVVRQDMMNALHSSPPSSLCLFSSSTAHSSPPAHPASCVQQLFAL